MDCISYGWITMEVDEAYIVDKESSCGLENKINQNNKKKTRSWLDICPMN